jgi:trigger factor
MQDRLINESNIVLPDGFMKRWLRTQNERNTEDVIERDYKKFADNLRWSLIRSKILKDANIEITDADLKESYANKIRGYFGGSMPIDDTFIDSLVEKVMADEKQFNELYEDVLTDKVFTTAKQSVKIASKPISVDEFNSVLAAARYDAAKERGEIEEAVTAEEVEA